MSRLRRTGLALVASTAALIVGLLLWSSDDPARETSSASSTAAPVATAAGAQDAAPAASVTAAAIDFAALRAPTLAPGMVEVCGFGRAEAGSAGEQALLGQLNERAEVVLREHLPRLRSSASPQVRAAGLMAERDAPALVEMALASSDPVIYAFARQLCGVNGPEIGEPACRRLGPQQATQRDPDNALTWIDAATAADARGDTPGLATALQRAALAGQVQAHEFRFFDLAWSAAPAALPPRDGLALAAALTGIQAAFSVRGMPTLRRYCDAAPADAGRRATCDALAQLLFARGNLLIELIIARDLAQKAGWPAPMVEQMRANQWAYTTAAAEPIRDAPGGPLGCAAMTWAVRSMLDQSRDGEVPTLRAAAARRGWSEQAALEAWRRWQAAFAPASAPR